jgi:peroxiredoxin Q/BCP
VLYAASCDDAETNRKFAESLSAEFAILSDPDKRVATAYGVLIPGVGLPNRWTFYIGTDGKILFIDKQVSPSTAGPDLVRRLEQLSVKRKSAP